MDCLENQLIEMDSCVKEICDGRWIYKTLGEAEEAAEVQLKLEVGS